MSGDPFVSGCRFDLVGAADGPLHGLTFAVKDLIDVAGHPTTAGTPDWTKYRPTPDRHAPVVTALLGAGAACIGKTITCELSLGILGFNHHQGTPTNPRAPGCFPGGSSSGSASAVAAGLCDFALGTDSGGSVRLPASFCGLFGLRPTHGRIPFAGGVVQAPSFDTIGWFAREGATMARVGEVLLGATVPETGPMPMLIATDAFAFADEDVRTALAPALSQLATILDAAPEDTTIAPPGLLEDWGRDRSLIQRSEAVKTFAPFLAQHNPRLHYTVARNLALGTFITETELAAARQTRAAAIARAEALLDGGAVLCLPATPFPAPELTTDAAQTDVLSARIGVLASFAGLAGLPQIVLPATSADDRPIGLSVIAARGGDERLLAIARAWRC